MTHSTAQSMTLVSQERVQAHPDSATTQTTAQITRATKSITRAYLQTTIQTRAQTETTALKTLVQVECVYPPIFAHVL